MSESPAGWFDAGADAFDHAAAAVWDPIGRTAAAATDARPGERVLDACCGTGASALPLAHAVGPDGHVDAIDLAPRLVAAGRRRTAGLRQLHFDVADATAWAEHAEPYDHVVCVLGVYFLPDLDESTRRLLANLRPGGSATITVWGEDALRPLAPALWNAAVREAPERFPAERERSRGEELGNPDELRRWGEALGLRDVSVTPAPYTATVDAAIAWSMVVGTAFAALLDGFDDAARDRVRSEIDVAMAAADWRLELPTLNLTGRRADR